MTDHSPGNPPTEERRSPPSDTLVNRGDAHLLISTTQAHLVDANGLTTQSPERPGRQPA